MLVATGSAQLKAKLQDKRRWRPTAMVMKKMPDAGWHTGDLADLPRRESMLPSAMRRPTMSSEFNTQ